MHGGDVSMRELQMLLSPHCKEGVDLGGAGTKIYSGVTYQMESGQAAAALGKLGPAAGAAGPALLGPLRQLCPVAATAKTARRTYNASSGRCKKSSAIIWRRRGLNT